MTIYQSHEKCPVCTEPATVARVDGDSKSHVRCSSGAEYCIGDTMFGKLRAHVSEMQRYHEAAKERRADKMFAMLRAGDNANRTQATGFVPRESLLR